MSYLPTFQPQNPALNGDAEGWTSCTAYSAAMAGDYDTLGTKRPTGNQVRDLTGDHTGGLSLPQVDAALLLGWDINVNTVLGGSWADFSAAIKAGKGAILQGLYAPIADSRFDAGRGFRGNHAIFVAPGFVTMDPLADGRYGQAYKYHAEPYPEALLRDFAGQLNLGYRAVGQGLCYASFTRDRVVTYEAHVGPGVRYTRYVVAIVNGQRKIVDHRNYVARSGFTAACTKPFQVVRQTIPETVPLAKITKPGSPLDGVWISAKYARET